MISEQRIAEAFKELYFASSGIDKDISKSNIDLDDMLGFWHGLGMASYRAFVYAQILGFEVTAKETDQIWEELDDFSCITRVGKEIEIMSELTEKEWEKINDFNNNSANDDDKVVGCMKKIIERHENGILQLRASSVLDELYYAFYPSLQKLDEIVKHDFSVETYDPCQDDRESQKQELEEV